jgi:hypothetical protein
VKAHTSIVFDASSPSDAVAIVSGWTLSSGAKLTLSVGEELPSPPVYRDVPIVSDPIVVGDDGRVDIDVSVRRIDSINPSQGPEQGGTEITIHGLGFTNIGGVRFEGSSGPQWAASFEVLNDYTLRCPTPPGTGVVDVIVFNGDPGDAKLPGGFTYV